MRFILLFIFLNCARAFAGPLGTVPTVDEGRTRFILDLRSDLWLRPSQDKQEPVRIFNNELRVPLFKINNWTASLYGQLETLSFGRTDLRVGPNQVTLGSSLRNEKIGFGIKQQYSALSSVSAFVSLNSASDEPFKNRRDQWTEISILYFSGMNDSGFQWVVLSNQSQNRGFYNGQWFPFVGVHINVNSEFSYSVGLPFLRLIWNKESGFNTTLIATPTGLSVTASHQITEKYLALAHAGVAAYSFLHTNRVEFDERAFYEEKYADIGFKYLLSEDTSIGMTLGGSVDRYVYSGEVAFQADTPRNHLTNDFYSRLILEFNL